MTLESARNQVLLAIKLKNLTKIIISQAVEIMMKYNLQLHLLIG